MNKNLIISLLSIMLTSSLILGCDLSMNKDRNKMNEPSNFKKKYIDNLDYRCLSGKESGAKNSQIKLDGNDNKNHSYYSRVSNVVNYYDKTYISCERK
ncbi:DUF5425 family lipoprotein (plasmid) [Borreliella andersonii]|uniref:DUF5425 family lipoprotein n=1 Tax=Borrelia andersonii TaxID=42109 RepID=A0ABZ0CG79_BORAD|nr:DUF5425 family lipoprotein [Borreliella andersonii]WNY66334.1 DUF5425 family lipoprotein [Borreliella andersonii]